jgi:NAD(P)-dependent dehydrogenase (short-subunit alcohol dehydrogenase family)
VARLQGKVAVITGAGSGIGREAARLFAREGAKVVIAELQEEAGRDAERELRAAGGEALFVHTDATSEKSAESAMRAAIEAFGRIDVLYNNAGASRNEDGPVASTPLAELRFALDVNVVTTWLCSHYAIPEIAKNGGGSIINVASVGALIGLKNRSGYCAAKGAVASLTRAMAVDCAAQKIRVNAIAPTFTLTERVTALMKSVPSDTRGVGGNLLGPAKPLDIAYVALYLASDESRVTTGQVIPVDSGLTTS